MIHFVCFVLETSMINFFPVSLEVIDERCSFFLVCGALHMSVCGPKMQMKRPHSSTSLIKAQILNVNYTLLYVTLLCIYAPIKLHYISPCLSVIICHLISSFPSFS